MCNFAIVNQQACQSVKVEAWFGLARKVHKYKQQHNKILRYEQDERFCMVVAQLGMEKVVSNIAVLRY